MKKYLITFIALVSLCSCQKDEQYENLNKNPKEPTEVDASFLFSSATVALSDQMQSPNVNLNIFRFISQYLTSTTYFEEPNYDLNGRGIADSHWSIIYRNVLFDLKDAKSNVEEDPDLTEGEKKARLAQIEVLQVYTWQIMVDTFGDIPYSQALNATEYALPKYDDAATIYEDLIARLTTARTDLEAGQGFSSADVIYEGDMAKWSKFANSLLLRLGMRISDSNSGLSQSTVTAAMSGDLFASNSDNATVTYYSGFPNTNPMWEDFVQSGRSDYVAANTIVDYMNALNDPRRTTYFTDNVTPYEGGVYGAETNVYSSYTHIGELFLDPTIPGILMDYAEVEFLLAEAAQIGGYGVPLTAAEYYNEGVTASILYWGGTQTEVDAYLLEPDVVYADTAEQLATQFWLAMFNNPFQGWCVWRKFDAPTLNVAEQSGLPIPLRYTYPIDEQNLNTGNRDAASSAIGGDQQQTALFWDVN